MFDILMAAVLVLGASDGYDLVLPFDDHTHVADGFPTYIDDRVVADQIPWVKSAGTRLSRCMTGMTVPQMLTVHYSPTVIGQHVVQTNVLRCEHEHLSQQLACNAGGIHERAYFDRDPDQYFESDATMAVDDIVAVAHAIIAGELSFAADVQDPQLAKKKGLLGTIEQSADGLAVRYGDCGCWGRMRLHRDAASGKFIVTHAGYDMCI